MLSQEATVILKKFLLGLGLAMTFLVVNASEPKPPESVEELLATYGWFVDRKDITAVMALFEDDAWLYSPRTSTNIRGKKAIAEMFTSAWEQDGESSKRRHLITGIRSEVGEAAQVRFFATFGVIGTSAQGESKAYNSGYYEGVVSTTEGGIRFQRMTIGVD